MLAERLSKAWRARRAAVPLRAAMSFVPEGLVLGAGTVLASAEANDGGVVIRLGGHEARLATLLAAAHLRAPTPRALNHIRKAAERWVEGDNGLAEIHLALSGVAALDAQGAQRLFLADGLLEAGIGPDAIVRALDLSPSFREPLDKDYRTQLRVPKGSGRPSGQWTTDGDGDEPADDERQGPSGGEVDASGADPRAYLIPAKYDALDPITAKPWPGSTPDLIETPGIVAPIIGRPWFFGLTGAQLGELALFALRFAGPVAALGTVFIPLNKSLSKEGVISGWPPIRYRWHSDEREIVFSYLGSNGGLATTTAELGEDGYFRNVDRKIIGRVLPGDALIIDRSALFPKEARGEDEPTLCPRPVPDVPHGKRGLAYENYMKAQINPGNPTPSGFGVRLTNALTGATAMFDDCQRRSGILFDYKDVTYAKLLTSSFSDSPMGKLITEARRQVTAASGGHIVWIFAEEAAREEVEKVFRKDSELRHIQLEHRPWPEGAI
jgi:hypothetical protein